MGNTASVDKLKQRFRELRERYPWLDHLVRAYAQYKFNQGDHQAAAITFFSFLSIFPILILAVSVLGFVLVGNDGLRDDVINAITDAIPGGIVTADTLDKVIENRGSVGLVGLVTLVLTGTSWVDNIRSAMESVWGRRPSSRNFFVTKGGDLLVLVILGITLAVSFTITGLGTALTGVVLSPLGLDDASWAAALALIVGLLLAIAWDTAAFTLVLTKLPRVDVTRASAIRGSLFAAVGFEILKVAATYYLASLSTNPAVVGFGSVVGVLIFLNLVSRFLLFSAAWTATFPREAGTSPVLAIVEAANDAEAGPAVPTGHRPAEVSPAAVGAGLVGAGAALGAVGVGAGGIYRRRRRRRSNRANARTKSSTTPA